MEVLKINILKASRWTGRGENSVIASAVVPLGSLSKKANQQVKINLEPSGSIELDLSYAEFVDHRGTL